MLVIFLGCGWKKGKVLQYQGRKNGLFPLKLRFSFNGNIRFQKKIQIIFSKTVTSDESHLL